MEANLTKLTNMRIKRTIENLEKNNMKALYVPTKNEALALIRTLLIKGETIAVGGSVTLSETGILDLVRNGDYNFLDRYDKNASKEVIVERLRQGLLADTFLMSANAITEEGQLYNVDGSGNRVAALIFGPKRVIVIAGYNKIVSSLSDAVVRVKKIAAPANGIRLDKDTFCAKHGRCIKDYCHSEDLMGIPAGCCQDTICCTSVVTGFQRWKDRITVILVGEELGY